ncbi:hypothetical protein K7432_016934 [Basidiobolus ranarum]|uniref:Uncharacterized protein n=1 Tax=Basidiobolus ranarum TaxID=34480 RepID=A0ABR2VKZ0_9FUNG
MRFILALLVILCTIFSAVAAPLPLDASVKVNTGPNSIPFTPGNCDDVNAKIRVSEVNVAAVVCLKSEEELPTDMLSNPSTQCPPDIDASINALGLNIRAILCLKDGIKVVATIQ